MLDVRSLAISNVKLISRAAADCRLPGSKQSAAEEYQMPGLQVAAPGVPQSRTNRRNPSAALAPFVRTSP